MSIKCVLHLLLFLLYSTCLVQCRRRHRVQARFEGPPKNEQPNDTWIDIDQIPHLVSVQLNDKHICSGSIISRFVVITAAQYVCDNRSIVIRFNPKGLTVRAGSNNLTQGGISLNVYEIKCHPEYNAITRNNDLALLRIADGLESIYYGFTGITLATHKPRHDTHALVAGWGILKGGSADELQAVEVKIVDRHKCQNSKYAHDGKVITSGMICAASKKQDFCQADVGGPLMAKDQLVGIISWGKGCATLDYPGVYVDVAHYDSWLKWQYFLPEEEYLNMSEMHLRIVGGTAMNIERIPYQVSLQRKGRHFCAGSIISPRFVLTAAHCVCGIKAHSINVRVGSSYWKNGGVFVDVAKIKCHENYISRNHINDIALVRLAWELQLNNYIAQIPLARCEPEDGAKALVSGWGTLNSGSRKPTDKLQGVWVQIIKRSECQNSGYADIDAVITQGMICAAERNKDACQGDSGGPLVSDGQLVGLVSWGRGCASREYPGVYANIAFYKKWINEKISKMEF